LDLREGRGFEAHLHAAAVFANARILHYFMQEL
jgi:hypothetical protein